MTISVFIERTVRVGAAGCKRLTSMAPAPTTPTIASANQIDNFSID
jgi:hypothetical protein